MSRVTVRWHTQAEEELAQLWLSSADQRSIGAAANETDSLLALNPATKGKPFALSVLDEASIELIEQRALVLPEDLRWIRCGPLDVFFRAMEDDGIALVIHVRPRRDRAV